MRKREKMISIKVSKEEKEQFKKYAKEANMNLSDYIRTQGMKYIPTDWSMPWWDKHKDTFYMVNKKIDQLNRDLAYKGYMDFKAYKKYTDLLNDAIEDIKKYLNDEIEY